MPDTPIVLVLCMENGTWEERTFSVPPDTDPAEWFRTGIGRTSPYRRVVHVLDAGPADTDTPE